MENEPLTNSNQENESGGETAADFSDTHLARHVADLQKANKEIRQVRRAALNLMEDAIQAKEELRLREEKYRTLFESIDEGFIISELVYNEAGQAVDYRFLELNQSFERHTGLKDASGRLASEVSPGTETYWLQIYAQVLQTGAPVRFEECNQSTQRWYRGYAARIEGAATQQFAVVFEEITGRKKAEQALRESEQRKAFLLKLSDAIRAIADPVAIQEATTALAMAYFQSDRCYYSEIKNGRATILREAAKEGLLSVVGTYDMDNVPLYKTVVDAGKPFIVEDVAVWDFVDEPLRQLCIELRVISFMNIPVIKENETTGILSLVQSTPRKWTHFEITLAEEVAERTWAAVERARVGEDLRKSEEKYRTLFTSIDEGFCIIEMLYNEAGEAVNYRFIEVNKSFERQTGLNNVVGKSGEELTPGTESYWIERYGKVIETGESVRFEDYHEGTHRWYESYASPLGSASSRQVAILFNDITERKRREQYQAFLAEITKELIELKSIEETTGKLSKKIGQHFGVAWCMFAELTQASQLSVNSYGWNDEQVPSIEGTYRMRDFISAEQLAKNNAGEVCIVSDTETDPNVRAENYAALNIRSFILVPRSRQGQWRFMLSIIETKPRQWREDEVDLMKTLTDRIWQWLERARAEKVLSESEEQKALLLKLSDTLQTITNPVDMQNAAMQLLGEQLGASRTYYFHIEHNNEGWVHVIENAYQQDAKAPSMVGSHPLKPFGSWLLEGLNQGKEVAVSDITAVEGLSQAELDVYLSIGVQAFLNIPLLRNGTFSAGIAVHSPVARNWKAYEIEMIREVAVRTWNAIDRVRAEEALRESENLFRSFVTTSSDSLYKMSADWRLMYRLEGKDFLLNTETTEVSWIDKYIPKEERKKVKSAIIHAIQNRTSFKLEHKVWDANGQIGWVYSRAVPAFDENGNIIEWFGAATNITQSKIAGEALQQSEERLRTLANAVPQIIWTNNAAGKADYFNQRWYEYTGLSNEQSAGPGWQTVVHPDDAPASINKWNKALTTGEIFDTEFRLKRHDGEYRWFICRTSPLKDNSGNIASWFGSATDVEDLKRTAEALSLSEARMRITMESATDYAIVSMDTGRRIEQWSKGAELLFGYTETEAIGQPADIIFTREDRQAHVPQREMEMARDTGSAPDEHWHQRKDGSRFYVSGVMRPIQNKVLTGYVKVMRDMTQQQLFTEDLHRLVDERTTELQASRDLLQSEFDASMTGIVVLHAVRNKTGEIVDFRYQLTNPVVERMAGQRLVGQYYREVLPKGWPSSLPDAFRKVVESGKSTDFEQHYQGENSAHWFRITAVKMDDGVVATVEDITVRKEAEAERLKNLKVLRQAEEVARMGSWEYDIQTRVFTWSEGMYRLFELPIGSAISLQTYLDYVTEEDRSLAEKLIRQIRRAKGPLAWTLRVQVNGQVLILKIQATVLADEAGQPVKVLGVDLDISELKRLEEENLRIRLDKQKQLLLAILEAQEEERRRISENLHNGVGQILYATKLNLTQVEQLAVQPSADLREALQRTETFLAEAILETRRASHELVPTLLREYGLDRAFGEFCHRFSGSGIAFSCYGLSERLPDYLETALYRIAQELVNNIVKHSQATRARVELSMDDTYLYLEAQDNGKGIPEGDGIPGKKQGKGIGLQTIRDRVKLLEGTIEVESSPVKGTLITIALPRPK